MVIFIDNRGSGEEELYNLLREKHLAVERRHIDSGDIVFGNEKGEYVGIERKTISDLLNSVTGMNRHFWDQLKVLKDTYKIPLVIIEGNIDYKNKLVSGIIFSILFGWKIPYVHTYNIYDTAEAVARMFTRYGSNRAKGYPPAGVKKEMTPEKIRWAMVQCIRGIGPKKASVILTEIPDLFTNKKLVSKLDKLSIPKRSKELIKAVFKGYNSIDIYRERKRELVNKVE